MEDLKETRKQFFAQLEQNLWEGRSEEDSIFCQHPSEEHIILSHALFWVMTWSLKGQVAKEKFLILLRNYEEEMLEAYLTENDYFPDLLHYCNILYEYLPIILPKIHNAKDARKLAAISIVASGYGGDMPEDQCDELLDDIDFHFNKVKCRKIEQMLPSLNMLVEEEAKRMTESI